MAVFLFMSSFVIIAANVPRAGSRAEITHRLSFNAFTLLIYKKFIKIRSLRLDARPVLAVRLKNSTPLTNKVKTDRLKCFIVLIIVVYIKIRCEANCAPTGIKIYVMNFAKNRLKLAFSYLIAIPYPRNAAAIAK